MYDVSTSASIVQELLVFITPTRRILHYCQKTLRANVAQVIIKVTYQYFNIIAVLRVFVYTSTHFMSVLLYGLIGVE